MSNDTATDVRSAVLKYLAEATGDATIASATGNISLRDCGLDSFGLFDVVLGLEEAFGITIDDEHLNVKNFESVDSIVAYLVERLPVANSPRHADAG
jgi:acyl carrier protein